MTRVDVIAPGPLTTIQDLGRAGWAHIGVPRSGAADRPALILANRLAGNPDGAAALETTLAGPRLRFDGPAVMALAGAPVSEVPMHQPISVKAGEELRIGAARRGLRTYIAFRGGIDAPLTLGSAATDVLSGLGPAPLRAGDVLELGFRGEKTTAGGGFLTPEAECATATVMRVLLGPRDDWFTRAAVAQLGGETFTVSPDSNRVGVRLRGPALERARGGDLRSEGLVPGALQVPPDGQPIVLLADHPTTGGGEFKRSSQHSIERSCDGQAERVGVGVDGAAGDEVAGAAAGGAQGASRAVLGGDRARGLDGGGGGRGGRVGGGWRPVVPRGWRDAVGHSRAAVGALPVVRRSRGDRAAARRRVWGAGDRWSAWALAVDDLAGAAS